jgi:hypothetical protein
MEFSVGQAFLLVDDGLKVLLLKMRNLINSVTQAACPD